MCTIQDIIVRWKRFKGFNVTWIPGMDHAGIATQIVVEKNLYKTKNLTRHDIGRDRFVEEVWRWKGEKGDRIKNDLKRMGISVDWDREYFTMDEVRSLTILYFFFNYLWFLFHRPNPVLCMKPSFVSLNKT